MSQNAKVATLDIGSVDGRIVNVVSGDLGNAATRYTYINMLREGYRFAAINFVITATTLTIEACNVVTDNNFVGARGTTFSGTCTSTSGGGTAIIDTTLNTSAGFIADTDLIGGLVKVTADATTPTNVGVIREITAYTAATGTATIAALPGAATSGVTQYQLIDNYGAGNLFNRLVSDPSGAQWTDVTSALTGSSTWTASGGWILDTSIVYDRIRIKRVTTNATNALSIRLARGR